MKAITQDSSDHLPYLCLMPSLCLQVMKAVADQYRLPAPHGCPAALHSLMLQCWQADRGDRPGFDSLLSSLDRLIRHPASLKAEPTRWVYSFWQTLPAEHIWGSRWRTICCSYGFWSTNFWHLQKLLPATAQPHPHWLNCSSDSQRLAESTEDGEISGWVWSSTPGHVRQSQQAHNGVSTVILLHYLILCCHIVLVLQPRWSAVDGFNWKILKNIKI